MNVGQLKRALKDWPDEWAVAVRTVEQGAVSLTVSLTSVEQYEPPLARPELLLVGDVDEAGN